MSQVITGSPIYFYPHGNTGPKIRLDRLSDEQLELFATILDDNFEDVFGGAVFLEMRVPVGRYASAEYLQQAQDLGIHMQNYGSGLEQGVYLAILGPRFAFKEMTRRVQQFRELAQNL